MKGLTERQKEILAFIDSFLQENGRSPSLRETGESLGMTPAAVHYAYKALAAKGAVTLCEGSPRGVQLAEEERMKRENLPIPFYLTEPTAEDLERGTEERFFVPRALATVESFAFRVSSYSMIASGIFPGDIAIVRKADSAKEGAIVLASAFPDSENRPELRRFRKFRNYEELWPDNDSMGIMRSQKVAIYGILYEIRRSY